MALTLNGKNDRLTLGNLLTFTRTIEFPLARAGEAMTDFVVAICLGANCIAAGMQAEVFVKTEDRTPLEYIVKPLKDQIAKAFRER